MAAVVDSVSKMLVFSNSVVAYETSAVYYGSESGYPLAGPHLKFGLVSNLVIKNEAGDSFFNICQLLKPDEEESFRHMVHDVLFPVHGAFRMRMLTPEEKGQIKEALSTGRAKIGIPSDDRSIRERVQQIVRVSLM